MSETITETTTATIEETDGTDGAGLADSPSIPADDAAGADDGGPGKLPTITGVFDADRAARALAAARGGETKAKNDAKAARALQQQAEDRLTAVMRALGLEKEVTPEELEAQLQASRAETKARTTELAVLRAAARTGVDPEVLLDSRSFLGSLEDLDLSSPSLTADVEAAIEAAMERNPRLKPAGGKTGVQAPVPVEAQVPAEKKSSTPRVPEAGRSGADFSDGSASAAGQLSVRDVQALAKSDPEALVAAYANGRLNQLITPDGE